MRYQKYDLTETRKAIRTVFARLRKKGWVARQNFMCCSNCAGYDIANKLEELRDAGDQRPGFTFYHRQDDQAFKECGCLHLRYGDSDYGSSTAEQIGKQLVEELNKFDLDVEWDGSTSKTILVYAPGAREN